MKSGCIVGTIILMYSNILAAHETQAKNTPIFSETLCLSELLSYVQNTTQQLIDADDETRQEAYHELQEGLTIIYAINYLHSDERSTIQDALDKCYQILSAAVDTASSNNNLLQHSLWLFTSNHDYEQRMLAAQSLHDWTDDQLTSNELRCAIETTDADIVYIQNNSSLRIEEETSKRAYHTPPLLLFRSRHLKRSLPNILIIKNETKPQDSSDYKIEVGRTWKLGGKDHGKSSSYIEGEVKDKNGNYASGKIAKEEDDDGYTADVKAGREKKYK